MVDPKSWELALYFLADFAPVDEALADELAVAIQETVETWINHAERQGLLQERHST